MSRDTKQHSLLANELVSTGQDFQNALAGLAPDQWSFRSASEAWTILQTAEHVALVEHSVARFLTAKLSGMPLSEDQRRGQKSRDALVTAALFDRNTRITAPPQAQPTGRYADPAEASAVFESQRGLILDWLAETELDLRGHGAPHPTLGLLDGKQWLLFSAAHCERHARQILEIKKDPRYPLGH